MSSFQAMGQALTFGGLRSLDSERRRFRQRISMLGIPATAVKNFAIGLVLDNCMQPTEVVDDVVTEILSHFACGSTVFGPAKSQGKLEWLLHKSDLIRMYDYLCKEDVLNCSQREFFDHFQFKGCPIKDISSSRWHSETFEGRTVGNSVCRNRFLERRVSDLIKSHRGSNLST